MYRRLRNVLVVLGGLTLLWVGCVGSGLFVSVVHRKEIAAMKDQSALAQAEIFERTRLKAEVRPSFQGSFVSGLSSVSVSVQYPFVPPTADPDLLVKTAEEVVRKHVQGVGAVEVLGAGPPRVAGPRR